MGFQLDPYAAQDRTDPPKKPQKGAMSLGLQEAEQLRVYVVGFRVHGLKMNLESLAHLAVPRSDLPLATKVGKSPRYN